ncbi:MAG: hypothetical protein FJZ78_07590 [Bacteroidetes bacterium]|nr:hypothetical protein [Bacteroidota bacterium]
MRILFFIIVCSLLSEKSFSQDFKQRYSNAKQLFEAANYDASLDAFKKLMVYDASNPYTEYAGFYYALSAYNRNYRSVARRTLASVDSLYPNWSQNDDVKYWLAQIYFEDGEPFQAMAKLKAMKNSSGTTPLKEKFIPKIKDVEVLRMLMDDFHDPIVIKTLIQRLFYQASEESIAEAKRMINLQGLRESDFVILPPRKIQNAKRVALLFPFLASSLDPSPGTKKNQYALDLYHGIRLAADSLEQLDIPVELSLYDTERNPEKLKSILSLNEVKSSSALIGPLFADEIELVKKFSSNENILMMHPVSSNPDYLSGNANAVLFQPSYVTLGKKSADYAAGLDRKGPCYVFFENTAKDSIVAHAFLQRAKELKLEVGLFRKIDRDNSSVINSILATAVKFDKFKNPIEFKLPKDSLASIFVASDSELIFTKVIRSVDSRDDGTVIIGQESWLDKPGMDWMKFEELRIALIAPNYYDVHSAEYKNFEKKYLAVHGMAPSNYARIGFEFMMFLGSKLSGNSSSPKSAVVLSGKNAGVIFQGTDYNGGQDNQAVPVITLKEGALVRIR